jgi:hypothetical protein
MTTTSQTKALTKAKSTSTTENIPKKTSRHNFTQETVNKLRRRAGNICSNPDCYKQTLEPQINNEEKTTDTGIAAHICAASENGPRYDKSMSEKDRKHISNAVWLCSHCATKIDREYSAYSVALLKQWKKSAEERIRINSNKRLYTEEEAEIKTHRTLFQSIGLSLPERFNYSLTEIAKAINKQISELDPRLDVKYSHINGCNHFEIRSTQLKADDDPILFKIIPSDPDQHKSKLEELYYHGRAVTFDVNEFTTNSDGLNLILPKNLVKGAVTLSPTNQKKALIELQDSDENTLISFEDFISIGSTTFSFNCEKYDGLVSLTIDKSPFVSSRQKRETTMTLNFKVWDGSNLLTLKYFDQIHKLYKQLYKSNGFYIKIFIDGHEIFWSKNDVKDELFQGVYSILSYTNNCRLLCQILKLNVNFSNGVLFTAEEHQQIYDAVENYKDTTVKDEFISNFIAERSGDFIPSEEFMGGVLRVEREENIEILNLFDQKISQKVFVQHVFSNVKGKTIYTKQNQIHVYNITLDNKDKSGMYTRTTSLTPVYMLGNNTKNLTLK